MNASHREPAGGPSGTSEPEDLLLGKKLKTTADWHLETLRRLNRQMGKLARFGAWVFDLNTHEVSLTPGLYKILGLRRSSRPSLQDIARLCSASEAVRARKALDQLIASGKPCELEIQVTTAKGALHSLLVKGELETHDGAPVRVIGTVQDITERKKAQAELIRLANQDALTGLSNRSMLAEKLAGARRKHSAETGVALLFVALDGFKRINDTFGHQVGDVLLQAVASRFRSVMPASSTLARLGGDEFALLMEDVTDRSQAAAMAERLLGAVSAPLRCRGRTLTITASVGIAHLPDRDTGASALMKAADIALHQAKQQGRNRFVVYEPDMGARIEARHVLLQDVRSALARQEFTVFYQPKIDLRTDRVAGFEALVRWRHPSRGVLSAGSFFEALQDAALGREISDLVITCVADQLAQWRGQHLDIGPVAVNLSSGQLQDPQFHRFVEDVLAATKLDPEAIKLEVTEGVLLDGSTGTVRDNLLNLHNSDIQLQLDDFGTGYASLTHLLQYPISRLKIDMSFVKQMLENVARQTIVKAIIDMGHGLGMEVTAEGVENREIADLLKAMGCDFAQGFFYSQAIPAEAVPAFVEQWNAKQSDAAPRAMTAP
jgi:diguanylate cyclase (GGDEF)-like protein/PAS domain S-box-containing protein